MYPNKKLLMKSLLVMLCLCSFVCIHDHKAQAVIDQTKTENTILDTVQLSKLYNLVEESQEIDSLTAFRYAFEGLQKANQLDDGKWQSKMNQLIGQLHFNAHQPDSSLYYYEQALTIAEKVNEQREIARSNSLLAKCHAYFYSSFAKAFDYSLAALHVWEQVDDKKEIVASYYQLADLLYYQEMATESLKYAMKSRDLAEEIGDQEGLMGAYYAIGYAYLRLNEPENAVIYFEKLLEARRKEGDQKKIVTALNGRGNSYKNNSEHSKAIIDYKEGLALARKIKYKRYIPVFINNIGHNYMLQEDYANALPYIKEGMSIMEKTGQNVNAIEGYQNLYTIYAGLGQYKNAFEHQLKYSEARDSAFNLESESIIGNLQTKYETDKKESTIAIQMQQIKQQKTTQWFFIAFLSLLGILLSVLYKNYATKQKLNNQLQITNKELEAKNQQNELLLKEIHHRVKNNLEIVSSLLSLQSRQLADQGAITAIKESQNRVQSMGIIHQKLYQGENLAAIEMKDYFVNLGDGLLDAFGKSGQVSIKYAMNELELDVDTAVPIGLIVNELLTNSMKYAFENVDHPEIEIQLERKADDTLSLFVSDNGVGKSTDSIAKGTGFGSQLIQLLTDQLEGVMSYAADHGSHFSFHFKPGHL